MKASGFVRRIDDLGRIVIPKEIRNSIRIKSGDTLEICLNNNDDIIIKKYSLISRIASLAQELTDSMNIFTKHNIIIMDNYEIIACSGSLKKKIINKPISSELFEKISRREKIMQNHIKELYLLDDMKINCSYVNTPIIIDGEVIGLIMILSEEEKVFEFEMKISEIVSSFISKYLAQ